MHKIQEKEFTLEDFSTEHLNNETMYLFEQIVNYLNISRDCYNSAVKEKEEFNGWIEISKDEYEDRKSRKL